MLAQIVRDQSVVGGFPQERGDPFEGVQKAHEIGVVVASLDFIFGRGNAVARGKRAHGCRLYGALKMKVQFGFRKFAQKTSLFCWHPNSLAPLGNFANRAVFLAKYRLPVRILRANLLVERRGGLVLLVVSQDLALASGGPTGSRLTDVRQRRFDFVQILDAFPGKGNASSSRGYLRDNMVAPAPQGKPLGRECLLFAAEIAVSNREGRGGRKIAAPLQRGAGSLAEACIEIPA